MGTEISIGLLELILESIFGTDYCNIKSKASVAGDVKGAGVGDIIVGVECTAAYLIYVKEGGMETYIDWNTPLALSQGFQISGSQFDR